MPSFFSKLVRPTSTTKNPYANPNHPNHNPTPQLPSSSFRPMPRPASPRGSFDYLAEARTAVGRDPVTGRKVPHQPTAVRDHPVPETMGGGAASGDGDMGVDVGVGSARVRLQSDGVASVATGSAGGGGGVGAKGGGWGVRNAEGTRYDAFVQDMKQRQVAGVEEPQGGYYAPERRVGEFYGPGSGG